MRIKELKRTKYACTGTKKVVIKYDGGFSLSDLTELEKAFPEKRVVYVSGGRIVLRQKRDKQ